MSILVESSLFSFSPFTLVSEILAYFCVLLFFPIAIWFFCRQWWAIKNTKLMAMALVVVITYATLFLMYNPGFVSYDDIVHFELTLSGVAYAWGSVTYSLILAVGAMITKSLAFPVILSMSIYLYMSFKTFEILARARLKKHIEILLGLFLMALLLHPLNQGLLLQHNRDILFSVMLMLLGFQFFNSKTPTVFRVVVLTAFIVVLSELRQEARIYLIVAPFLFWLFKKWNKTHLKIYTVTAIILGTGYYYFLPNYFGVKAYDYRYQLTAYVLPLSQIFHDHDLADFTSEQIQNIDDVIKIEALREHFNPIDIDPARAENSISDLSTEKMIKFKITAHELFLTHWKTFLKNRVNLTLSALNLFQHQPLVFWDELRSNPQKFNDLERQLPRGWMPEPLSERANWYMHQMYGILYKRDITSMIFFSGLIPISFLFLAVLYFWRLPSLAASALIVIARLPILFLLAPASYVKYIYSVCLFFIFGIVILSAFLCNQKKEDNIESNSLKEN